MSEIIIVEDDFELAVQWTTALRADGLHVFAAINADEALNAMTARAFDLMIIDIFIGTDAQANTVGGITLIHGVRSGAFLSKPTAPIIAVSGSRLAVDPEATDTERDDNSFEGRILSMGANRFMRKPFEPARLVQLTREFLSPE